jgi:hypothetical protein
MKDVSFDRYLTDIEGAQSTQSKQAHQIFKSSNNAAIISGVQVNDGGYSNKGDIYYSNPSADAKKNSTEFIFNPEKHTFLNRLSMTLYQNKMKPHKKTMMPVMSQNTSGLPSMLQLKFRNSILPK